MIPPSVSQSGTGRSGVLAVDPMTNPFNVGIATAVTYGAAVFNIEYSFDDPAEVGYSPAASTWYIATGFNGISDATAGALTVPCRAVSINITSGSGTVKLTTTQAGLR